MGLAHSPRIVTDGLVFYYDMGNPQKSWKGAPATNIIFANPTWAGDGSNQGAFVKESVLVTDNSLTYQGLQTFLYSPGASLNCYLQGSGSDFPSTASTQWTFSCYVKRQDGAAITSMSVYMYYPSSDGSAAGTVENVGDGWYRIYRTRTGTSNAISLAGFTGMAGSVKYYLSGAMLTATTVPVAALAGTASRSNTQAILDLTNNNTITASSLTYASDNTFSFNGSSNYITLPSSIGYTTEFSQMAWFKSAGTPAGGYHIVYGGEQAELSIPTAGELRIGVNTGTRYVGNLGSGLTDGNWHYVAMTYKPSDGAIKGYIDGLSVGTIATNSGNPVSSFTRTVGRSGTSTTYYTNGETPLTQIYNRALTAQEIKQNFNALRGRYGI